MAEWRANARVAFQLRTMSRFGILSMQARSKPLQKIADCWRAERIRPGPGLRGQDFAPESPRRTMLAARPASLQATDEAAYSPPGRMSKPPLAPFLPSHRGEVVDMHSGELLHRRHGGSAAGFVAEGRQLVLAHIRV